MAMIDLAYDGNVFRLSRVFWGDDLLKEAGGLQKAKALELRIPEEEFTAEQMMVILCDSYGNEKRLLLKKDEFQGDVSGAELRRSKRKRSVK